MIKRHLLLASTIAGYAMVAHAHAADVVGGAYLAEGNRWTGFYCGVSAGYITYDADVTYANGLDYYSGNPADYDGGFLVGDKLSVSDQAALLGVNCGYDYQFDSGLVVGLQGDFHVAPDLGGSDMQERTHEYGENGDPTAEAHFTSELTNLSMFRGKIGYGFNRFNVYVTGGLAAGSVKSSFYDEYIHAPTTGTALNKDVNFLSPSNGYSTTDLRLGYVVGAGTEYALTENLSLKVEGLFYDLGKLTSGTKVQKDNFHDFTPPGSTPIKDVDPYGSYDDTASGMVVMTGLNLRF